MFNGRHGLLSVSASLLLLLGQATPYATAQPTGADETEQQPEQAPGPGDDQAAETTTDTPLEETQTQEKPEDEEEEPAEGDQAAGQAKKIQFAPVRVRVTCSATNTKWTGHQLEGGRILDVAFPECTYTPALTGGGKLLLRSEVVLNPDAPIAKCVSLSAAFMFYIEVDAAATKAPGLAWEGYYVVEDQLAISNLYGETISLDFVPIYDPSTKADADKPLSYHMFPSRTTPSFDEYYVGTVELLAEDGSTGLSREIFRVSPPVSEVKEGDWDIDVSLKVEIFKPKGWCYAAGPDGNVVEPPLSINFKVAGT